MKTIRLLISAVVATLASTLVQAAELPVIPAPVSWQASGGTSAVEGKRWSYSDASLKPLIDVLASELPGARFTEAAEAVKGTIHLQLESGDAADESYRIALGEEVRVTAKSASGLFYGTRTLMQLLSSGEGLPAGVIEDKPKYPVRSMLIDVGRKFATVDELKGWIRLLGWFKFNELHMHLNDNSWGRYPGYRLESMAFPGISSKDGFYTWAEIRELQDFARVRGVTIVPEIDAPGHSLAFTSYDPTLAHPEIDRNGFGLAYLDVRNPEAIAFMEKLLDEVAPHFDAGEFHIGTDEYRIGLIKKKEDREEAGELFRQWINHFAKHLQENHGKQARIWSGYEHLPGTTEPGREIVVDMWETSDAKAKSAAGYRFVNSSHFFTYIVPGAPYYGVNNRGIYENWSPLIFANKEGAILDEGDPGLLGGKLHIWNDFGPTGYTWNEIARLARPSMEAFGEKLWGTKGSADYSAFGKRTDRMGTRIPAVSLLTRQAEGEGDVLWTMEEEKEFIANSSLDIKHPAGNLEWPWTASFTVTRKNDVAGDEVLIGSELAAFYLDLTHTSGKGDKKTTRRGVACVRANQAPGYSPLTSYNPDALVFDYQVPVGRKVRLTFVGEERRTSLYVDGSLVGTIGKQMVCPLGQVGAQKLPRGFHGALHEAVIKTVAPKREMVGEWTPERFENGACVFAAELPAGTSAVSFDYKSGAHGVEIEKVELRAGTRVLHRFEQKGFAGGRPVDHVFEIPAEHRKVDKLTLRAVLTGRDGTDSRGRVEASGGF